MAQHATAPARELETKSAPVELKMGIAPALFFSPRPDLSGLRVKSPNQPAIYLIDPEGYRRWIPNPQTYNNLFRGWDGVIVDINIDEIAASTPLSDGAILARADGTAPVYIVSNGIKRWITSPQAMDKYDFNWARVYVVPGVLVDSIPTGASWS
jgi:hypothetical protein